MENETDHARIRLLETEVALLKKEAEHNQERFENVEEDMSTIQLMAEEIRKNFHAHKEDFRELKTKVAMYLVVAGGIIAVLTPIVSAIMQYILRTK